MQFSLTKLLWKSIADSLDFERSRILSMRDYRSTLTCVRFLRFSSNFFSLCSYISNTFVLRASPALFNFFLARSIFTRLSTYVWWLCKSKERALACLTASRAWVFVLWVWDLAERVRCLVSDFDLNVAFRRSSFIRSSAHSLSSCLSKSCLRYFLADSARTARFLLASAS